MTRLARAADWADRFARRISWCLTAVSAVCVFAIVAVLVVASTQRYLLTSPNAWTEEMAAYLFIALSFFSVVGGFVDGRHIRLLPLWQRLPRGLQNWGMLAGHLAAIGVLALIIRETFAFARSSLAFGTRSYVADLLEWPWMMIIPVCLGLLALVLALRVVADLGRIARGLPAPEARPAQQPEQQSEGV